MRIGIGIVGGGVIARLILEHIRDGALLVLLKTVVECVLTMRQSRRTACR